MSEKQGGAPPPCFWPPDARSQDQVPQDKRPDGEIASLYPYSARTYLKDHRKLETGDFVLREAG